DTETKYPGDQAETPDSTAGNACRMLLGNRVVFGKDVNAISRVRDRAPFEVPSRFRIREARLSGSNARLDKLCGKGVATKAGWMKARRKLLDGAVPPAKNRVVDNVRLQPGATVRRKAD